MKLLPALVILLAPLGIGVQAALASPGAGSAARYEAKVCIACPYGGSTEPTSYDCQMSGGYVVGTPDCDDGGCANLSTCVCCDWYR